LTAPGVTCVVAVGEDAALGGFAQMMSDGEIQAFLANLLVAPSLRQGGVGRALIWEALRLVGGQRVDLLTDTAEEFYERLPHRRFAGFRVYPTHNG
jgi:predicted N-acetyltransferase YhbS